MMWTTDYTRSLILAFCLWSSAIALEVTPNSPCASRCIDVNATDVTDSASSSTYAKDLHCYDWTFAGSEATDIGKKFKDCNNCLKSSGYASDKDEESDRGWFLCEFDSTWSLAYTLPLGPWRTVLTYTSDLLYISFFDQY